jgi:predicted dinucleotide-binding enzyme
MDRSRLSAAVYKRTGIVIDPGDPAFAVVEPNRLVIEEVASRVAERLETLPERIQSSAKALATEVAHQGAQRVVETLREARQTIASDSEEAQRRIAERIEKARGTVAREVAAAMRAALPSRRAGATRRGWLLACAAVGLVSCTGGFRRAIDDNR